MSFTIVDRLIDCARSQPEKVAFRYLADQAESPQELTYGDLYKSAQDIANFLLAVAEPSSRIMLFFPPGLHYIKAFYGCLLAGMIAVPLYPPKKNSRSDRIVNVARSCDSIIALTTQAELDNIKSTLHENASGQLKLDLYSTDEPSLFSSSFGIARKNVIPEIAFLQFTSGSTGLPKGVIITHQNIIANVEHLRLTTTAHQDDVFVNWLPLFHDLGLVTAVLLPVYLGSTSILMSPVTFVRNPMVWLKAISNYRGTIGGAPNFAYDLCVKKITEAEVLGLDLASWRIAFNAAEPIRSSTLDNFFKQFSPGGFKSAAFYPSYGMAEATVFISGGDSALESHQILVKKNSISSNKIEITDEAVFDAIKLVSCGSVLAPHDVRVVDASTKVELGDGDIGEIWFSGPSVSPGYWGREDLTELTFNHQVSDTNSAGFLRTGDLGFKWNGQLYVTGRMKDLIILHGKNHYPQDIEFSVAASDESLRSGGCVAFSRAENDLEVLCVVAEVERAAFKKINPKEVERKIKNAVLRDHSLNVHEVMLLKPHKLPVTSSGKVQRQLTRQLLIDGRLKDFSFYVSEIANDFTAAGTELEKFLCEAWCEVLNLEFVGVNDNFFDVGGASVSALEVSYKIHARFGHVELDMERLFEYPTVAMLARYIELKNTHHTQKTLNTAGMRKVVII